VFIDGCFWHKCPKCFIKPKSRNGYWDKKLENGCRLDRLGRSLPHLIETITSLSARGIGFKSITEAIDTTTSGGKLIFHIFGALAEFERDIIRERTQAGLTAARARGRKGGRPKALNPKKIQQAQTLYNAKTITIDEICRTLNISRATLYRYIKTS
jgi:DNA invertase Pin-like site-specific DNA recombinase